MKKHLTTTGSLQSERNKQAYMSICRYRCETRAVYLRWGCPSKYCPGRRHSRREVLPGLLRSPWRRVPIISLNSSVNSGVLSRNVRLRQALSNSGVPVLRFAVKDPMQPIFWSSPRLLSPPMQTISSGRMGYRLQFHFSGPCSFPAGGWVRYFSSIFGEVFPF